MLLLKVTGFGEKIGNFFIDLGTKAYDWGRNLVGTFAGGMLAAAATILSKVLTAIGNFIAKFFAGHSPPEMGPLSHIDEWGKNVFDTYLKGFLDADFGILKGIGDIIAKIFSTFEKTGIIGDKKDVGLLLQARVNLAKLLDTFRKTGKISESVLKETVKDLGNQADEVAELIRRWVKYEDIQQKIKDLEEKKADRLQAYEDEVDFIAASNKSAEERVDLIRSAMRERDREIKKIEVEKKGLEGQSDEAKSQLDLQKDLVDTMQDQDDILLKLLDTLDKLGGGGGLGDLQFPEGSFTLDVDTSELDNALGESLSGFLTLEEQIGIAGKAWEAFKLGFSGGTPQGLQAIQDSVRDIAMAELPPDYKDLVDKGAVPLEDLSPRLQQLQEMYDQGKKIRSVWDTVQGSFEKIQGAIDGLKTTFTETFGEGSTFSEAVKDIKTSLTELIPVLESLKKEDTGKGLELPEGVQKGWQNFLDGVGEVWDFLHQDWSFGEEIGKIWESAMEPWNKAKENFDKWAEAIDMILEQSGLNEWLDSLGISWERTGTAIGNVGAWIVAIIGWVLEKIVLLAAWVVGFLIRLIGWIVSTVVWVAGFIGMMITGLAGVILNIAKWIGKAWDDIKAFFKGGRKDSEGEVSALSGSLISIIAGLLPTVIGIISNLVKQFSYKFFVLKLEVKRLIDDIRRSFLAKLADIQYDFWKAVDYVKGLFTSSALLQKGKDFVSGLWDGIKAKYAELKTWVTTKVQELLSLFDLGWDMKSPSKETEKRGEYLGMGLEKGLVSSFASVFATTMQLTSDLPPLFSSAFDMNYDALPEGNTQNNGGDIIMHFGKDSVRSDDDIKKIAGEVERIINKRSSAYLNYGGRR